MSIDYIAILQNRITFHSQYVEGTFLELVKTIHLYFDLTIGNKGGVRFSLEDKILDVFYAIVFQPDNPKFDGLDFDECRRQAFILIERYLDYYSSSCMNPELVRKRYPGINEIWSELNTHSVRNLIGVV